MREGNGSNSSLQRREQFEAPNFQWREKLGLRIYIDWSEKEEEFDQLFVMKKNVATKNLLDGEEEKDLWKTKKLQRRIRSLNLLDGE
jgi:hypothetical protein